MICVRISQDSGICLLMCCCCGRWRPHFVRELVEWQKSRCCCCSSRDRKHHLWKTSTVLFPCMCKRKCEWEWSHDSSFFALVSRFQEPWFVCCFLRHMSAPRRLFLGGVSFCNILGECTCFGYGEMHWIWLLGQRNLCLLLMRSRCSRVLF